jgi:hypothetical protein
VGLNFLFTFLVLAVGMVVAFVSTAPEIPVLPLTLGFMGAAVLVPLVFYPFTNTIWLAVDLLARNPDAAELVDAALAVAGTARD